MKLITLAIRNIKRSFSKYAMYFCPQFQRFYCLLLPSPYV